MTDMAVGLFFFNISKLAESTIYTVSFVQAVVTGESSAIFLLFAPADSLFATFRWNTSIMGYFNALTISWKTIQHNLLFDLGGFWRCAIVFGCFVLFCYGIFFCKGITMEADQGNLKQPPNPRSNANFLSVMFYW